MKRGYHCSGLNVSCLLMLLTACSGDPKSSDGQTPTRSAGSGSSANASGTAATAIPDASNIDNASDTLLPSVDAGILPSAGGSTAPKTPEVCDGEDNDHNGIVDDVDVQGDGVCDCLKIGVIGQIGPWGNGSNVLKEWLNSRSTTPAVELGNQILTTDLLKPLQVIIVLYTAETEFTYNNQTLTAHHAFSPDEVAALHAWVEAGGGLMTTIGYLVDEQTDTANVDRLLAAFEVKYDPNKGLSGFIQDWTDHPVTAGVKKIWTDRGAVPSGNVGTSLAKDSMNQEVLRVLTPSKGHLLAWGDEWITYDSQWKDVTDQQVERLWLNIFKWLTPANMCQVPLF